MPVAGFFFYSSAIKDNKCQQMWTVAGARTQKSRRTTMDGRGWLLLILLTIIVDGCPLILVVFKDCLVIPVVISGDSSRGI